MFHRRQKILGFGDTHIHGTVLQPLPLGTQLIYGQETSDMRTAGNLNSSMRDFVSTHQCMEDLKEWVDVVSVRIVARKER